MTEAGRESSEQLVADKYRLTRMIGRGGMGSVWEGVHSTLGTRVAVKFIESEYLDSPEARSRFENEARAAAKLHSKHVVQVYDHGVMPDGRPYIVMEFLSGEPLDARLDRVGRLSAEDTARILNQVCRALAKAHQLGIVHRDLKPENVFLVWDDDDQADIAKVVDFGIAKFTDASMGVSSATRTGSVLGTPYFMSPEQARGLRSVDYRSDLWAVGVIAYRCIVGRLPFEGEAVGDLLVKICTAPLPVPSQQAPGVPAGFDAWFVKALSREPAARFASAAELAQALMAAAGMGVRGEMQSSMGAQFAGVPGTPYVAGAPTPATGQQPAYQTPATGAHPAMATPATGSYATGGVGVTGAGASPAAHTAAPLTHTAGGPKRTAPVGALVAVLGVGLLVVGIGVAALVKVTGGGDEAAAAHAADDPAPAQQAQGEEPGEVEVTPAELPTTPAPSDSAAASASAAAEEPEKADEPARPTRTARSRPRTAARPRAPAAPPRPPPAAPRPPPSPPPRSGTVDIGY